MTTIFGASPMGVGLSKAAVTQDPSYLPPAAGGTSGPTPTPAELQRRQNQALARAGRPDTLASRGSPAAAGGAYASKTLNGAS